ncbi:MAG: GNAT family N-acetyltransferase [bacterium]|nr:GNAT family N-acetyltransferase [bacterium]
MCHARELFADLRDPRIYAFMPDDPPLSVEALALRYVIWERRQSPDGRERWLNWVVRLAHGGEPVGLLQATVPTRGAALVAYLLFPRRWGKGYAREGVRRVLELLFVEYGVERVAASIDTRNDRSIALVRSLGFQCAGCTRVADPIKGAPSDEYRFELTASQACPTSAAPPPRT